MSENTPNLDLAKPDRGCVNWDVSLNNNFDKIDEAVGDVSALADGKIIVGSAAGVATDISMNGDITIDNLGNTTIGADKITSAKAAPTYMKVVSGSLTADVSGNFAFKWQNPEDAKILVHRVIIDITTAGGTAGSLLDVGIVDASANTSDNLIDGFDLNNTNAGDNISDGGTNGRSIQKLDEKNGTTDWITGKILIADASSLVGKYYIFYTEVAA